MSLLEIMKHFEIGMWLSVNQMMVTVEALREVRLTGDDPIGDEQRQRDLVIFGGVQPYIDDLELVASSATVRRIVALCRSDAPVVPSVIDPLIIDLKNRLRDEMEARRFLGLTPSETKQYDDPRNGWAEVIARFADATTDIDEAAKCFALSRYAASVFHSTQIAEVGLIATGTFLGVSDPNPGFTATNREMSRFLKRDHGTLTTSERRHRPFVEQLNQTAEAMRTAWRNKISHAQGRLVLMSSDFAPDVAEEILIATRSFMRRLATDLPKRPMKRGP